MEKVIDKPRPKAMTESRGCFSSLQVQASPQAVQPLPPNVPVLTFYKFLDFEDFGANEFCLFLKVQVIYINYFS